MSVVVEEEPLPPIPKGKQWSQEENAILLECMANAAKPIEGFRQAVEKLGHARTLQQCKSHYDYVRKDPGFPLVSGVRLRSKRWSNADDLELMELLRQYGRYHDAWQLISEQLSGTQRTPQQVETHTRCVLSKKYPHTRELYMDKPDAVVKRRKRRGGKGPVVAAVAAVEQDEDIYRAIRGTEEEEETTMPQPESELPLPPESPRPSADTTSPSESVASPSAESDGSYETSEDQRARKRHKRSR
jgi:hypothetical protein